MNRIDRTGGPEVALRTGFTCLLVIVLLPALALLAVWLFSGGSYRLSVRAETETMLVTWHGGVITSWYLPPAARYRFAQSTHQDLFPTGKRLQIPDDAQVEFSATEGRLSLIVRPPQEGQAIHISLPDGTDRKPFDGRIAIECDTSCGPLTLPVAGQITIGSALQAEPDGRQPMLITGSLSAQKARLLEGSEGPDVVVVATAPLGMGEEVRIMSGPGTEAALSHGVVRAIAGSPLSVNVMGWGDRIERNMSGAATTHFRPLFIDYLRNEPYLQVIGAFLIFVAANIGTILIGASFNALARCRPRTPE
jgi:hypothetical protein